MNLSKLLHQILYHAGKFLTKQYFLKENVLPEICHQLFVLFVSLCSATRRQPLLPEHRGRASPSDCVGTDLLWGEQTLTVSAPLQSCTETLLAPKI